MSQDPDSILQHLLTAITLVKEPGIGAPQDVWHPEYGWVLKDGKATETTEAYVNELNILGDSKHVSRDLERPSTGIG
jgi:hypothetical protein